MQEITQLKVDELEEIIQNALVIIEHLQMALNYIHDNFEILPDERFQCKIPQEHFEIMAEMIRNNGGKMGIA